MIESRHVIAKKAVCSFLAHPVFSNFMRRYRVLEVNLKRICNFY